MMDGCQAVEICFSGDLKKQTYANDQQPDELYALLQQDFPWVRREEYFSISTPTFHEVLEEEVVTCCIPQLQARMLLGDDVILGARKFCMQSKTSYLREYKLHEGENPEWLPAGSRLWFSTLNRAEFGRPFPPKASTFRDYYFAGPEDDIEAHFGLPSKRGAYQTYFGATLVDGQVARIKQYCYDEQNIGSDWDAVFIAHCKKVGKEHLL